MCFQYKMWEVSFLPGRMAKRVMVSCLKGCRPKSLPFLQLFHRCYLDDVSVCCESLDNPCKTVTLQFTGVCCKSSSGPSFTVSVNWHSRQGGIQTGFFFSAETGPVLSVRSLPVHCLETLVDCGFPDMTLPLGHCSAFMSQWPHLHEPHNVTEV